MRNWSRFGMALPDFCTDRRRLPMSKRLIHPALAQFVAATAGRNMTKAAYVAVTAGIAMMVLLTVAPAYEAAHHWVDAVLWACLGLFRIRMGGAAAPRRACRSAAGLTCCPSAGWSTPSAAIAVPVAIVCRRRTQDGVAARRAVGAQGGSGHSGLAAIAPGAGAGIRPAVERAGDLPDGAVSRLRRRLFPGTRRPAGDLRQRAGDVVVGGRDPDHGRIWRRGADHAARPAGRGAGDDLRPRRVRALDRYSRHRLCRGDPPRQFPEDLGIRQQGAVLRSARSRPPSPTSPICCAPWICRRAP